MKKPSLFNLASTSELLEDRSPIEKAWEKLLPPDGRNKARHLYSIKLEYISLMRDRSERQVRNSESIRALKKQISDIDRYAQHGGKLTAADIKERSELAAELASTQGSAKELLDSPPPPPLGADGVWRLCEHEPRATYKHKAHEYSGSTNPAALEAALDKARADIESKDDMIRSTLGADCTLAEAFAGAEAFVKRIARNGGGTKIEKLFRYQRTQNGYAQAKPHPYLGRETSSAITAADVRAEMHDLFGGSILATYKGRLKAIHNPKNALSIKQRVETVARLSAGKLSLEREEESIVMAGLRAGIPLTRRLNANMLAVLEIEPDTKQAAPPPTGATRGALAVAEPGDALEGDEIDEDENEFG
jgi:hypothetical protein